MYSMNFMIKTICIVFFIHTSWTLSTESPPKAEAFTQDNLNRPTREKSDSSRSSRFLFNKDDYYKRYPYITGYQQPATGYQPQPPLRDDPRYPAYPARDQGGYLPRDDPRYPAYPPRDDQRYAPRDQGYQSRGGYEDRNWYYQPERYDDRYNNRYDDRYDNRQPQQQQQQPGVGGYYDRDRYDTRYPSAGTQNYRGNGYDNRDTLQYDQQRDGFYRGGNTYDRGYDSRTNYDRDRGYDRYNPQNTRGYDNKNFRPWDETYSNTYSSRQRPLGNTSYLHDRDTNVTPVDDTKKVKPVDNKTDLTTNTDTNSNNPSGTTSKDDKNKV